MELLILILFLFGIFVSIFYLFEGRKKSYKNINAKLNSKYYQNFEDWRLEFQEVQEFTEEGSNLTGTVISYKHLSSFEKELASILGIKKDFNSQILKKSFRSKILQNHPDKFDKSSTAEYEEANKRCKKINKAYKILSEKFYED